MRVESIYEVNNKNQLIVNVPEIFKKKKEILVILDDSINKVKNKLNLIKKAASDPLFLEDIEEINEDFSLIDSETL